MTKNVMPTLLIVFMVMTVTSVAIVLPVSAQTAILLTAGAQPTNVPAGQVLTLRAHVRNPSLTLGVYVNVSFIGYDETGKIPLWFNTNAEYMRPHSQLWLTVDWTVPLEYGGLRFYVTAGLYYSATPAGPWTIDGSRSFAFRVTY